MINLAADAPALCDAIERALGLQRIIRYCGKHHFAAETARHEAAAAIEGPIRLESVADHCWHLSYIATLLFPYFPNLDQARVLQLLTLHDILELITGDEDPTGTDGTGHTGHALNAALAQAKLDKERAALDEHLRDLPPTVAAVHRALLEEEQGCASAEARFVRVLDKLQCVFFIHAVKQGTLSATGLQYLTDQMQKVLPLFPALEPLYAEALLRLRNNSARGSVDCVISAVG